MVRGRLVQGVPGPGGVCSGGSAPGGSAAGGGGWWYPIMH